MWWFQFNEAGKDGSNLGLQLDRLLSWLAQVSIKLLICYQMFYLHFSSLISVFLCSIWPLISLGDLKFEWYAINQFLICLELIQRRSCFGFYKSAYAPIEGEEHYNSSKIDDRASQKPLLYDSFLSSSTYDLEHSYFNQNNSSLHSLEKGISSANHQAEGSGVDSHEFKNHGNYLPNKLF